ncbi:MAG: ComEC/Rec2 family competence protein [Rhodoluna sp.]|nr:ComEC/Rec2 family competence protein [Rhodoluna sp.]
MTLSVAAVVLWGLLALVATVNEIPSWLLLALGGALFAIAIFLPDRKRALAALLGAALALSGLSFWLQSQINKPDWLVDYSASNAKAVVVVEVLNRPKAISTDFGKNPIYGVAVRLQEINEESVSGRGYLIYSEAKLVRGNVIEVEASFEDAGRNARDAFLLKPKGEITIVSEPLGQLALFNDLRANYVALLSGVTPDSKVLVAGLAMGETADLSEELEEQMRSVSLTHLVAVSGANCAIVVGMVYLICVRLRLGRTVRTVVSLTSLVGYVMLVGPDPSVLRAAVMTASVIVMVSLGRRTWALNALAIAAIILLIADPWLAVEYGFGLSVLATSGILLLAPAMTEKLATKMPLPLALGLSVTMSAQLLCLPLLVQLQPGLPTYSIAANLLAGPMVAPVTVLGILAVTLTPIAPWLVGPITWLASLGTFLIESVAIFFAELPIVYFPWVTGLSATLLSGLLILMVSAWLRSNLPRLRQASVAGLVILAVATLSVPAASEILPGGWPLSDWEVVACDVGQGDALVIKSLGRVAVVDVGKDEERIDGCLTELGVTTIDLLVLTHFDFDHVGGLTGALGGRVVSHAIVSGFPDDRPATKSSLDQLKEIGAQVIIAEPTISGSLGEFGWRVLAPTKTASEAKDSNDASVTMVFRSSRFDLVLLGDLGAEGQERVSKSVMQVLASSSNPLILKVSHHGSNDQSASFHEQLKPDLALISVGTENGYGHPGKQALQILGSVGAQVLRTDLLGAIAISSAGGELQWSATGR